MAVILSVPLLSPPIKLAKFSSNISSSGFVNADTLAISIFSIFYYSLLMHSSFDKQSHIPSQAIIIKQSFSSRSLIVTSGNGLTAYYSGGKSFLSLYSRSPKALLSASEPSTRFSITWWPAAVILWSSI